MKKTVTVLLGRGAVRRGGIVRRRPAEKKRQNGNEELADRAGEGRRHPDCRGDVENGTRGGSVLSPDGRTVLYTVTRYDMEQNKGTTDIWSVRPEAARPSV